MSQDFNIIDVPVGIQNEEEKEMEEVKQPKVHMENVETYKIAVNSLKGELIELVKEGHMTESVAERIITDFMFNTFTQVVKLRLE